MKKYSGLGFYIVVLVLGILSYLVLNGSEALGIPSVKNIRFGIDIKGGVYARLYPEIEGDRPTEKQLDAAEAIINTRLDNKGIFDRNVYPESENGRIIVEIPWQSGEQDFNPQSVIDELGETALLTFQEVDYEQVDELGRFKPTGKIILKGDDIQDASPQPDTQRGGMLVLLTLTSEGRQKFAEATARLVGEPIAIFMDDTFISAPIVDEKIDMDTAVITLGGDRNETISKAKELADKISAGNLPFKLVARNVRSISPTLGEGALDVAVRAGILSFILVFIFMVLYYRLPGFLSCIALLGLVVLELLALSVTQISVTLPGIAGIILSIGMGVDANIIIFERIREELKAGKTLMAAIDMGFKRAFSAILDSNVTTIMSAIALYWLGTGPVKGFAVTLAIGVLLSFFTSVTVSRTLLKSVAGWKLARNKWLYGVKEVTQ